MTGLQSLTFCLVAATLGLVSTDSYKDFGTCWPYNGDSHKRGLCIHIINKERTWSQANDLCSKFQASLPLESDIEAVYKRLFWYHSTTSKKVFFFVKGKDPKVVGYEMVSMDDRKVIMDPERESQVICIRKRAPKYQCPPEFLFYENYTACFHHNQDVRRNFWDCKTYCNSKGGFPVVFDTYSQMWNIQVYFLGKYRTKGYNRLEDGYWTGHLIPNTFKGVRNLKTMRANMYQIDGSIQSNRNSMTNAFLRNEPNGGGNTGRDEHCIEFWPTFGFNDYFCTSTTLGCTCRAIPDQINRNSNNTSQDCLCLSPVYFRHLLSPSLYAYNAAYLAYGYNYDTNCVTCGHP